MVSKSVDKTFLKHKLENWDNILAPLNEKHIESIRQLESSSIPPFQSKKKSVNLSKSSNDGNQKETGSKIDNINQFLDWFSNIELQMQENENHKYITFIEDLKVWSDQCCHLLDSIGQNLECLDTLSKEYNFVSDKSTSLHHACESLLAEQSKLVASYETLSHKLNHFTDYEVLSQKLDSPTLSVLNEAFIPLLTKVDESISFLEAHPHFKESELFLAKFRYLQTNALGMIKNYVVTILQQTTQQLLGQWENLGPSENTYTLFYSKFCTSAPRVLSLMEQIELRVEENKDYEQLLSDCHECYFDQRELMLEPSVPSTVQDLISQHKKDHSALVRSSCVFLIHLCQDEHQVFQQFFSQPTIKLEEFLISICGRFYDLLRPIVIQIHHLETLSELCSILKVEMLDEHSNVKDLSAFEKVTQNLLQDVQERLVYRAYKYIRSDILGYLPAPGDLAYPEKLEMMESIAESMADRRSRSNSVSSLNSIPCIELNSSFTSPSIGGPAVLKVSSSSRSSVISMGSRQNSNSPADMHGMWYPTVRRTLVCLSRLYRCLDKMAFQEICQEALHNCIFSLVRASFGIGKRKTPLDGQLFQIKHLLILREQITPFQIDFAIKEASVDFSKIKDAAYNLFSHKESLLSLKSDNAILEFVVKGSPQVSETLLDSKKDVDTQLKLICEEFFAYSSNLFAGPLIIFIEKVKVILQIQKEEPSRHVTLPNQPFAIPALVQSMVSEVYRTVKTTLPIFHRQLSLYLGNTDTQYILFGPIKARIQSAFEQLIQIIRTNYSEEDQLLIGCPSLEQITIVLALANKQ